MPMDAARIMDTGLDAMLAGEHQTDLVAVWHRNRKLMINSALIIRRQPLSMTCELQAILGCEQSPLVVVAVERRQQDAEDCGLELVEAAVYAEFDALVCLIQTVVAQTFDPGRNHGVIGRDRAAVTGGT